MVGPIMSRPYLVMVDGKLWARKLTQAGALKLIQWLRSEKNINATFAYDIGSY